MRPRGLGDKIVAIAVGSGMALSLSVRLRVTYAGGAGNGCKLGKSFAKTGRHVFCKEEAPCPAVHGTADYLEALIVRQWGKHM